jgi:hypothetical protein
LSEEISRQLREAAEAHEPDRRRILARVQRSIAGAEVRHRTPGIARAWPRVALAGLAATGVLATAGLTVAGIVQTAPAHPDNVTSVTAPAPSGTPNSTTSTRTTDSSAPPPTHGQPDETTTGRLTTPDSNSAPPTDNQHSDGPLSSEGSIDPHSHAYWTQSRLVLTTTQPLTALTVELRIAQTGGVQTAGQWQTGPGNDFTITVRKIDGALVYRWDLKPGRTVPTGQHDFAAQYNHPNGARDTHADNYVAQATAADGTHAVRGGFAPAG